MENEKFKDLVLEHLVKLTQDVTGLTHAVTGLARDMAEVKQELNQVKESVIRIENDHGAKDDLSSYQRTF